MSANNSSQPTPKFSANSDEVDISSKLTSLLPPNGRWALTPSGEGLQRVIKFKTFRSAMDFMFATAKDCKTNKHHPEWSNTYDTMFVRWTTHRPKGLSELDVRMASITDEHAREFGEVVPKEEGEGMRRIGAKQVEDVVALVDDVVEKAGDCCSPKSKKVTDVEAA